MHILFDVIVFDDDRDKIFADQSAFEVQRLFLCTKAENRKNRIYEY